jgi:hypothetical protein
MWENSEVSEAEGSLELGLSKWKVELLAALQVGATEDLCHHKQRLKQVLGSKLVLKSIN